MIPNQWYIVMASRQVKERPVGVTRMGEKLVFWRNRKSKLHPKGTVSCLRDKCIHRGVQLSKGTIKDNGHLQCPFHGFEYDTTGRVQVIPANGKNAPVPERFKVHRYLTYEAHGFIWIWWGLEEPADLKPPRFFEDIDDSFSFSTIYDHWNAHYSRVIENQLDVVHLPFVHHNTIGRGNRTLVDGPVVQWVGDNIFKFYVYNRTDDGTTPRKPNDIIPDPQRDFSLAFIFPNLWQNYISQNTRVLAAFAPVDEEHTILYLRFYQNFIKIPVLRKIITSIAMPFNRFIAHQDRRVVTTQQPKRSELHNKEQLLQGDLPIVAYRRRRQQLLKEQAK
jgi:phenylpropionate dioxygenase-like ring-hydroxylating dioxygenase large terminal subunit